jgi:hypothetical protein
MPHPLLHFVCLFSTALALAPATAHVMELPNKISLPKAEYQVAQQVYRGWALVGVIVVIALVSNLTLALSLRTQQEPFVTALIACLCIVGTQAIFWLVTFPTNRRTKNWTVFPENWDELASGGSTPMWPPPFSTLSPSSRLFSLYCGRATHRFNERLQH